MEEMLKPIRNALNEPFWAGGEEGRLVLPTCKVTGQAFWPPSPISPFRTGGGVDWRETAPVGILICAVAYRRIFQKAFEPLTPYGIGLIELYAGPRLMAHLPSPDDLTAPRPGNAVRVVFTRLLEGGPTVPTIFRLPLEVGKGSAVP